MIRLRDKMKKEIKILKEGNLTFWAKKGENTFSRDIKGLLDYLEIEYEETSQKE